MSYYQQQQQQGQQQGQQGQQYNNVMDVSKPRVRVIQIEEPYERLFFDDGKTRYVVKVCKVNGVPKVGFTRFFYSNQYGKFVPGNACFMTVPAWETLSTNKDLMKEVSSRAGRLQLQCMLLSTI